MRRFVILLSVLVLVLLPSVSGAVSMDITALSDEELTVMKTKLDEQMKFRGLYTLLELKSGVSGEEVLAVQRKLGALGYLDVEPTGRFDSKTIAAFKAFEKASGIKPDGIAAISDQELLFSDKAIAKPTPTPKPTPKPKPTKKPTPTPDPRKAYKTFDFDSAARYPSEYRGSRVKISGRVLQVLGDRTGGFEMRVATRGRYDNVIYIITSGGHSANILEDDKITFFCTLAGDYTYKSTMGQSITLPIAECDFYEYPR